MSQRILIFRILRHCTGLEKHNGQSTEGLWISVIGDSVIQNIYSDIKGKHLRHWKNNDHYYAVKLNWPADKVPDVVIFTLGYHTTWLSVEEFGETVDELFRLYDKQMKMKELPVKQSVYYMLNIMPKPELIEDNLDCDRPKRTLINEYWKNRAVLDAATKHDFIKIIDLFSIELPFNEKCHKDAVHMLSDDNDRDCKVQKIFADAILRAICEGDQKD